MGVCLQVSNTTFIGGAFQCHCSVFSIAKIFSTQYLSTQYHLTSKNMTNITNISAKSSFPFATLFVLFPLTVASLSVVAYQQAQVKTTTVVDCSAVRFSPKASSCQMQVSYMLLPKSTASNP
jgi:hypothetical protein